MAIFNSYVSLPEGNCILGWLNHPPVKFITFPYHARIVCTWWSWSRRRRSTVSNAWQSTMPGSPAFGAMAGFWWKKSVFFTKNGGLSMLIPSGLKNHPFVGEKILEQTWTLEIARDWAQVPKNCLCPGQLWRTTSDCWVMYAPDHVVG